MTHWKRLWCWEGLGAGGEGDDRGWDGWMASLTRWTWVWVNSRSWWWTGRPGVLWFMGLQRFRHDWATELNWSILSVKEVKGLRNQRYTGYLIWKITWLWWERSLFPTFSVTEENLDENFRWNLDAPFVKEGMEKVWSPGKSFIQVRWQREKFRNFFFLI